MMIFEIFAPPGLLDIARQQRISRRLRSELADPAQMSPGASTVFGSLFHVIVHEPAGWLVDGDPTDRHYLVRVTVPGPWRKDVSGPIIQAATAALTEVHPGGHRPEVQVLVAGVSEGSLGLRGGVTTSADLVELMNEPHRGDLEAGRALLDPLCGVLVPLTDSAVTLEHNGELLAFCCAGCRNAYLDRERRAATR